MILLTSTLRRFAGALAVVVVAAGSAQASTVYGGVTFPDGDKSFADEVVAFALGPLVSTNFDDPNDVLGAPDYSASTGSFSLGNPPAGTAPTGFITIRFTDNSLTTSGDSEADVFIFEIGGAVELYTVEISKNNVDWITVATAIGQPGKFDIDAVAGVNAGDQFTYVRVSDAVGGVSSGSPFGGPDIDAIGAISSAPPCANRTPASSGLGLAGRFGRLGLCTPPRVAPAKYEFGSRLSGRLSFWPLLG